MGLLFAKTQNKQLKIGFGRQHNPQRPSNHISTTKYSLITFLPKALVIQFTKAANFVYLISAVLNSISFISSLAPISAIGPLTFVLFVSLIRQGFEDYKRHSKDTQVNQRITLRLVNRQFKQINWQHIHPGDIIKVKRGQMIPCDMTILYTSEENSICYVETSNLDGETNLKTKYAFTEQIVLYPDQFQLLQGYLEVEIPNNQLQQFNGQIKLLNHQPKHLTFENLLLRETHLKNTSEIVGIAIYCGKQSKIMMNKGHIEHKVSNVERKVNIIQLILFLILVGMCIACSLGFYLHHNQTGRQNYFYLKYNGFTLTVECKQFSDIAILIFLTCFLLLNFLIPVSLNVLIEFTKGLLTLFLVFDKKFKDEFSPDGIHISNMSIMQELGIIDYILTDKTGTLTSNNMIFRSCCIQDRVYSTDMLQRMSQQLGENSAFHNFWISVVLCHDVIKDIFTDKYQGSSPDEVCFVDYAKKIGYEFIKRTKKYIEINIRGQKVVYEILYVIPFSLRKRMTVIVKAITSNDDILMFTKGADSAIIQKSIKSNNHNRQFFQSNIDEYAKQGLRTLVFSYRKLKIQQFQQILQSQKQFRLQKFMKYKTEQELNQIEKQMIEKIQNNLIILGATAIQDKLQDEVPETISRLQQAGISIMMITGDKLQTAENIGYLAHLMNKQFRIIKIKSNQINLSETIKMYLEQLNKPNHQKIGVIIEGLAIRKIVEEEDEKIRQIYAKFIKKCTSVIFCRSSPQQKALIVKFVKKQLEGTVLAIGDGGNDTEMIQAANIGIGILGRQGNSAASVSDFYFGQFKHLDRLLLHHGRWFYWRISYFFVYYGWKNVIMTTLMFMYILKSAYSGYPGFSQFYIAMYNLLIGFFIIGYYGVWAQDVNDDILPHIWEKLPLLYKKTKQQDLFSYKRYLIWSLLGISIAVFLQFFIDLSVGSPNITVSSNGYVVDYDCLYLTKSISIIIITLVVIIMDFKSYTCITLIFGIGILTFLPIIIVYLMQNVQYLGRGYESLVTYDQPKIFSVVLIVFGVTIAIKTIINMIVVEFYPSQIDKILKQKNKKTSFSIFQSNNKIINPKQLVLSAEDSLSDKQIKKKNNFVQQKMQDQLKQQKIKQKSAKKPNKKLQNSQQKQVLNFNNDFQIKIHKKQQNNNKTKTKLSFLQNQSL